jgi:hypothetical protein
MKAIIRNGVPEQVFGSFTDNAGVKHPANVLTLWSDEELAAIDVYPVTDSTVPEGHVVTGSRLEWDGTAVTRVFTSAPPSVEELARRLRAERDEKLRESDTEILRLYVGENIPVPQEWCNYRQGLRDVPQQSTFPSHIEWPGRPKI